MSTDRQPNNEMNLAWSLISQTSISVFLTGNAGTGKTTFLKKLRELSPKRMVVLAPTGVAAINAHGQTIHSFFQLPFGPILPGSQIKQKKSYMMSQDKKNLIRTLDLLVIDEVSMVRCDLLDAIDIELRKYKNRYKPFGGVQLLLIGDLQQLPPVVKDQEWQLLKDTYKSPYFFESKALQQTDFVTVALKRIYRQQDAAFIDILSKIRDNRLDAPAIETLNRRVAPYFTPPAGEDWIRLTTHNRMADAYNSRMLASLDAPAIHFQAKVKGAFPETSFPAENDLVLKVGAQVMFLKNDSSEEHAYYNGKIGTITAINEDTVCVSTKEDGITVKVGCEEWENTKYTIDKETNEIHEEVEGTFRQFPLRLAWAITVHKSQGLTFDHAVLDINESFAHGQAYVALSRCRSLEGLVLTAPISPSAVITDDTVRRFIDNALPATEHAREHLVQLKHRYFLELLDEAFSFDTMRMQLSYLCRVVDEHLYKKHPEYNQWLKETLVRFSTEIVDVAGKFAVQYRALAAAAADPAKDPALQERVGKAFTYFKERLEALAKELAQYRSIRIDNKQTAEQYRNAYTALSETLAMKTAVATAMQSCPFTVKSYLEAKAKASLPQPVKKTTQRQKDNKPKAKPSADVPDSAGQPWTEEADRKLAELYSKDYNLAVIAKMFGRTRGSIRSRIKKLGLLSE